MPKVLVIDNTTVHLPKLVNMIERQIADADIFIERQESVKPEHMRQAGLIILSGGTGRSIENNPHIFRSMVKLAEDSKKPTIGICLGAEAIADYYGAGLEQMPVRRVGNIPIYLNEGVWPELDSRRQTVYEFHKWKVVNLKKPLIAMADSKDGPEIFRHQSLPMLGFQFHPEVNRKQNSGGLLFGIALHAIAPKLKLLETVGTQS